MRHVLITGITGYIGSRLARTLLPDCQIYGLARQPLNDAYLTQELREKIVFLPYDGSGESVMEAMETSRPDAVYHLAACYTTAHDMPAVIQLLNSNLALGTYLLEAMCAARCRRLVYTTTVTTHCTGAEYRPLTLYAATKQAFSSLVEYYTSAGLLNAAALALPDTYGPGDRRPKVLNLIRQTVLSSAPLDLTSGRQIFDTVYIDDVVRGLVTTAAALEHTNTAHSFFQLFGAAPRSLRDTVDLMLRVNGLTYQVNWGGRPDPEYLTETPIRIYPAPPDWKPQVLLEDGLRRFWNDTSSEQGGDQLG